MKKMIYGQHLKRLLLDSGSCYGYNYFILNLGTHPTAYVEVPKSHKYFMSMYDNIDINVHGGLTYSEDFLYISKEQKLKGWFIGWDYAHFDDFIGYELNYPVEFRTNGKKWTTEEIQKDVYEVCKQLFEAEKSDK